MAGGEPTLKEDVGKSHTAAQVQVNHLLGGELQDFFFFFVLDFCKTGYKTNQKNKTKKHLFFQAFSQKQQRRQQKTRNSQPHRTAPTGYFMGD